MTIFQDNQHRILKLLSETFPLRDLEFIINDMGLSLYKRVGPNKLTITPRETASGCSLKITWSPNVPVNIAGHPRKSMAFRFVLGSLPALNLTLNYNKAKLRLVLQEIIDVFTKAGMVPRVAPDGPSFVERELGRFLGLERDAKYPVLILGEQGASKTVEARSYGKNHAFDLYVEVGGHQGMEAYDFIGGQIPLGPGQMVWIDGPVAQAFRAASLGRKVYLCIDEMLRVPRRELSIFLTALSPFKGMYRLTTGRPVNIREGVADMEVIEAPVKNLSIVATTNIGGQFDIEELDPAAKERWHHVYVYVDAALLSVVLGKILAARGFEVPETQRKLIAFFDAMKKVKQDNFCETTPTLRTFERAIGVARSVGEIRHELRAMVNTWVGVDPDGRPIQEQVEAVRKAIDVAFP